MAPRAEERYDIIVFAWVATPFASSNQPIYGSSRRPCAARTGHYTNPQVDALLTQAATTLDPTKAATLYNQVDAILWKDMVTLPLFQQPRLNTWTSTFANVLPNASSVGLTWNAQTWGVKAS